MKVMQKIVLIILVITCLFSLVACNERKKKKKGANSEPTIQTEGDFVEDLSTDDFVNNTVIFY